MESTRERLEPGSPEKIALLAERVARRQSLFADGAEPAEPAPPPEPVRPARRAAPAPQPVRPPEPPKGATSTVLRQEEGPAPEHSAKAAEARLRAAGFEPGSPPHVGEYARCIDATTAAKMRCRACQQRGLLCQPFRHRQTNAVYRVLAICPQCHTAEEI